MSSFAHFEEKRSIYIRDRIEYLIDYLRIWSDCPNHRKRIQPLARVLKKTRCPTSVLSSIKNKGWRYGLLARTSHEFSLKVERLLKVINRSKEIPNILTSSRFSKFRPRLRGDSLFLETPEIIIENINFGVFGIEYNWQKNDLSFDSTRMLKPFRDAYLFIKCEEAYHPLTYDIGLFRKLEHYIADYSNDSSLTGLLYCLIEMLLGRKIDFSKIIEEHWGSRKCRYCLEKVDSREDIFQCDECRNFICSSCHVLEVWRTLDDEKQVYDLCQDCALSMMEK